MNFCVHVFIEFRNGKILDVFSELMKTLLSPDFRPGSEQKGKYVISFVENNLNF